MTLLYRISGSFAFMSFLGALFVIVTFALYKDLKKHPTQMIFYLSLCDMVFSLKYVITSVIPHSYSLQNYESVCYIQAALQQFFGLASIGWSGMISLNLIITSIRPFKNTATYAKFYQFWVWSLSAITTAIIFIFDRDSISKSGDGTCWLKNRSLIRLTFFVPLLTYIALSIGSLITTFVYSRGTYHSYDKGRMGMLVRMSLYTAIFIICWLGPLIHRVYQWVEEGSDNNDELDNSWFMYFDAMGVSIQGFFNAMVWLTNPQFFNAMIKNLKKLMPKADFSQDETIPLFSTLTDESQDPTQLAKLLRQNIITCCLKGIQLSIRDNGSNSRVSSRTTDHTISFTNESDCNLTKQNVYDEKDLFNQELSSTPNSSVLKKHIFKDYNPLIYARIRQLQGISDEQFLESFNCNTFFDKLSNQKFSEGKSGSFMCFTPDNQYLIKTITADESKLLRKLIINFYSYFKTNNQSFLTKFYGSYKVVMPNGHFVYLAIMSNVFSSCTQKIVERYDLKGSGINRGGKPDYDRYGTLGLDLDFINTRTSISISTRDRDMIIHQMARDSEFLKSLNIMDYSLLIGIHENKPTTPPTSPLYQTLPSSLIPKHILQQQQQQEQEQERQQNQQHSASPLSLSLPSSPKSKSTSITVESMNISNQDDNDNEFEEVSIGLRQSFNSEYLTTTTTTTTTTNTPTNGFNNNFNVISSLNNKEIYYIGIIDILQLYDFDKKAERFLKVYFMMKNGQQISSAAPEFYQERFMKRIKQIVTDLFN